MFIFLYTKQHLKRIFSLKVVRKIILPVCLLCCSFLVKAQKSKWGTSFTPALVQSPTIHYGAQAGAEYRINDRLSVLTEIAFATGNHQDSSSRNSKYFRIKPELRYHLFETRRGYKVYTGVQISYSFRKWNDLNGGCYFNKKLYPDTLITYNKASINSPILTSSLQLGTLVPISDHFYIDLFIGMGIRMIFTKYSGIENASKDLYNQPVCKIVPAPDPAYWVNGTVSRFHSNFGIRLLYRF
jgi:hypothetical protein